MAASLAFLLGTPGSANGQAMSVYRCVDAAGRIALQDQPCPPGQLDQRREIRIEAAAPDRSDDDATASSVPPLPPDPQAPSAPPSRDPPPPLWRCVDFEGKSRLSPRNDPNPRYVPYWVVAGNEAGPRGLAGRAGSPPPRAGGSGPGGPGTALPGQLPPMVLVEDRCRLLAPGAACEAYRKQRDEARRSEFQSRSEAERTAHAEQAQASQAILDRHCGG